MLFTFFEVALLLKSLEAILPTLGEVFSFFAIPSPPRSKFKSSRRRLLPSIAVSVTVINEGR